MNIDNKPYTVGELREMLSNYICGNGDILGKVYFKAHLGEGTRPLPKGVKDLDDFIDTNAGMRTVPGSREDEYEDVSELLVELREDINNLKVLTKKSHPHPGLNLFICKWMDKLDSFE